MISFILEVSRETPVAKPAIAGNLKQNQSVEPNRKSLLVTVVDPTTPEKSNPYQGFYLLEKVIKA